MPNPAPEVGVAVGMSELTLCSLPGVWPRAVARAQAGVREVTAVCERKTETV